MKNCTPLWREAHFEVKMYKTHILYEQLTHLVNVLYRFSSTSPTRQYVQHKNELGILNHVEHVLSSLTKQHGEFMNKVKSVNLFSHISAPPTLQNNTLNRRRKLAFWVNFAIYHPSTLPDNMLTLLTLWRKLTGWVLLIGWPHQNTVFNIVQHMNQRGILSYD